MAGLQCNKFKGDNGRVILVLVIRVMLLVLGKTMQVDNQGLLTATNVKVKDIWLGNALSLNKQGYKDKAMLDEAREARKFLDEEQLAFLTGDLDTYDFDCDDISNAKAVLMANISNYDFDVISEENANKEQNNESVTAELERYKERVKTFEQRFNIDLSSHEKMIDSQMDDMIKEKLALKEKVDSLEQNFFKQIKEKESLLQTFTVFKNESKEKENKYMENEIDLEKRIKELDNIIFKVGQSAQTKAQRIKPTLYDDIVISAKHVDMPVIDNEETLILEEESRSKMSKKEKDPEFDSVVKKRTTPDARIEGKEIVDIAAQTPSYYTIVPGMFKLDLEPLAPRLLQNREVHIDYLKYTHEQADILQGIVEQAKTKQPLDNKLDFACKHAQQIQELLVYVRDTCPNAIKLSAKKVAVTPKTKIKKVRFVEPLTFSSNIKQVESSATSDSNTHVLSPIGLKYSTRNYGSKPTCNKKNDMILRTPSRNMKNKLKVQPRKVNKKNRVVEPIRNVDVTHSLLKVNSKLICATCCPDCSLISGLQMLKTYDREPLLAHELFQKAPAPRAVVLANSPVSTSIDQDAPSTSIPSTQEKEHSLNISQGSSSNVRQTHTPFEHLGRWTKDRPIANVTSNPSRPVSTRKQLQTNAMWCYFDAFLTSIEPKNFKQEMTEPSWIDTMQEEIHEFERLQVWELVLCQDKVMLIKLKWIYKVKMDEFGGDTDMSLTAYADADHAGCQETRRSTSGSAQFLGDKLVKGLKTEQKRVFSGSFRSRVLNIQDEDEVINISRACHWKEHEIMVPAMPPSFIGIMDTTKAQKALDDALVAPADRQEFEDLPLKHDILSFIRDLRHSRDIIHLTDNIDYVYILWEDLLFQIENKEARKTNKMSCPRFKKIINDYFMSKDQSILRRNKMFWHTARDDTMFTSMRCISRHEDTQVYGTILPKELTNLEMLESKAYKTYYAFASGEKTPKPKYVRKKADSDTSPKQKPVQATKDTRIKIKAKVHDKQHLKTSGADEGTDTIPEVPDVLIYESEKEKIDDEDTMDEEGDDEVTKEIYDDVNVNLGNEDTDMTNIDQGTMFLNMDQLEKQLDNEEFQELGPMAAFKVLETQFQMFIKLRIYLDDEYVTMTRNYFLEYTQLEILEFRDTLIQHMESVKKSIDKQALQKREYDSTMTKRQMQTTEVKVDTSKVLDASLVDTESSGTESKEYDTSSRSRNDAHADNAYIKPIYDEEPMAEGKESVCAKPHHMIAPGSSWYSLNDMVHNHYLEEAKKKAQESRRNSEPSTIGLRWVPTTKIFTSSTSKVDSEPINGSNEDITNQYEYEQTLDVSAGTLNLSADTTTPSKQKLDLLFGPLYDEFFNAGTSNVNKSSSPTDSSKQQDIPPSATAQSTTELITPTTTITVEDNIGSNTLSLKPRQGETKLQGRFLVSFQDDAKYDHVGQDTRSQGGKDDQDKQGKDLKILDVKTKSKDNDKGSRSKITQHEETSLQQVKDQDKDKIKVIPGSENEIASLMDTTTSHAMAVPEITSVFPTPIPPPLLFFNPLSFNDHLERDLFELKQVNHYAQAIFSIPVIVDRYMDNKVDFETVIEKNVTESLEVTVLTRSSSQLKLMFEAAPSLLEGVETTKKKIKTPPLDQSKGRKEGNQVKMLSHPEIQGQRKRSLQAPLKMPPNLNISIMESLLMQGSQVTLLMTQECKRIKSSTRTWISQVARAKEPRTSLDELMDTFFDFSAFVMNRLNIKDPTQEILIGPAFELLKGTCKSLTELEYHLEECSKATTERLDWHNLK
nr:integrase, catalytic region, zinc finger, CCHC-type, peptidase aspartic, catalytic [Tanacetum cinerariifolium]